MRRFLLTFVVLLSGAAVFMALPLRSVAVLTVTVTDQAGRPVESKASATYFDEGGRSIVNITSRTAGSWSNRLHWWSHSRSPNSLLTPQDAQRAVSVLVTADGCEPAQAPVALTRDYEPPSLMPHGGGAAYFIYRFDADVVLNCG